MSGTVVEIFRFEMRDGDIISTNLPHVGASRGSSGTSGVGMVSYVGLTQSPGAMPRQCRTGRGDDLPCTSPPDPSVMRSTPFPSLRPTSRRSATRRSSPDCSRAIHPRLLPRYQQLLGRVHRGGRAPGNHPAAHPLDDGPDRLPVHTVTLHGHMTTTVGQKPILQRSNIFSERPKCSHLSNLGGDQTHRHRLLVHIQTAASLV